MASENKSKDELIAERQANLELPEDPPVASDWNSSDARTVNVTAETKQAELPTETEGGLDADSAATEDASDAQS